MTTSPHIHPTAFISPDAEIAPDVQVGPFVVIEGRVRVGPGCIIRPHAQLIGPLTLGAGNYVGCGSVLGERPQHLKYADEETFTVIGNHNIIREHVTIHRAAIPGGQTVLGNHNFLMVNTHVGHDCIIGNHCILTNGALIAGHCELADRAYLSGNAAIHQFVRVGRLAMLGGLGASTKDIPPFVIQFRYNQLVGINVVGMRRAGMSTSQITAARQAFRILFMQGRAMPEAISKVERDLGHIDTAAEMVTFIRASKRGVARVRGLDHEYAPLDRQAA